MRYQRREDIPADDEITKWELLVEKYRERNELDILAQVIEERGNDLMTAAIWKKVVRMFPSDLELAERWLLTSESIGSNEVFINYYHQSFRHSQSDKVLKELEMALVDHGDQDAEISIWKTLIDSYPAWFEKLASSLKNAFERKGNVDAAITTWEALVYSYPHADNGLHHYLTEACRKNGDGNSCLAIWRALAEAYPTSMPIAEQLAKALRSPLRKDEIPYKASKSSKAPSIPKEIKIWKNLVVDYADDSDLLARLEDVFNIKGDVDVRVAVWKELANSYPNNIYYRNRYGMAMAKMLSRNALNMNE